MTDCDQWADAEGHGGRVGRPYYPEQYDELEHQTTLQ